MLSRVAWWLLDVDQGGFWWHAQHSSDFPAQIQHTPISTVIFIFHFMHTGGLPLFTSNTDGFLFRFFRRQRPAML